ncbi:hypothetical protein PCH_Pc21g13900 [Penicillium rubens Wisconsin 54-1255]|uniref:Uncharacterized protein n=1 Tax=Penicillium rubens (strain ATCC 28089 / DSM 1075 / NRRL 1951 / Wisconsin 54-1255) TaxID=500485 RepID=B6HNR5_PENRW|nr:hypothetical protein PCH_Pc21g13900 [Penicillium rubens Wisconsin 54-1255]
MAFETTVFENQALFEGASTTTIREHFQQWATAAIQEDYNVSPHVLRFFNIEAAPGGGDQSHLEYYDLEELEESEPKDFIDNACDPIEGCTVDAGLFGFSRMGENDVLCSVIEPGTEHYLLVSSSMGDSKELYISYDVGSNPSDRDTEYLADQADS